MASVRKNTRSKSSSARWPRFVICVDNEGYPVSLELGKVYREIKPHPKDRAGWMRVIDESGEDYLFPAERFVPLKLPPKARRALQAPVA